MQDLPDIAARNVEIKARIDDVRSLASKAAAIATEGPVELLQDDAFFQCAHGRLKLRVSPGAAAELIFYLRANSQGPRESFYLRVPVSAPDDLRAALSLACGPMGRIRKRRTLYLVGRARIHLDEVDGLGHFVELEVVMAPGEPSEGGVREAYELMEKLGIRSSQLIEGAYIDLLA